MATIENYERLIAGIEAETERCKRAQAALPTLKRDLAHAKEGLRLRLRTDRGADVSNYKNLIAQIEYEQTMGKDAKKRLPTLRKDLAHAKAGLKELKGQIAALKREASSSRRLHGVQQAVAPGLPNLDLRGRHVRQRRQWRA